MHLRGVIRLCLLLVWILWWPGNLSAQIFPWTYEEIEEDVSQSGARPDLHVDAQGGFHVSFWNANTDQLTYAHRPPGSGAWTQEAVPESGTLGYTSAIVVDDNGEVHLAYHHNDAGRATLRYAHRATNGDWTIERLRDSIDVGRYGADLSYPSYVWPSIDIFLQPNGRPGVLYFDGNRGTIQFCSVAAIRDSYYGYELDLNVVFQTVSGWTDVAFPNVAYTGNITCINRGDRFGEFCQMLTRSDGSYLTLVPGMHNHDLVLFRSLGSSLVQWKDTRVDSISRYMSGPSFFESFSYLDVALEGDTVLHAVYQITEHYGFENRDNRGNREALIYARIVLDSVDSIGHGYEPYRYRFPGGNEPRFYPTLSLLNDSLVAITYFQRARGQLIQAVSDDRGLTWRDADTLLEMDTNAPLHSELVGDSLHVLVYDSGRDILRQTVQQVDLLGQSVDESITRTSRSGTVLASVVRRVNNDDEIRVAYREAYSGSLRLAERVNGTWTFEEILPPGNPVSTLELGQADDGQLHLVYLIEGTNRVTHATRTGGSWQAELLPDSAIATQLSLDLAGDALHLAYYDPQPGHLKYARLNGSTWTQAVIDSSGPQVGRHPALAVDVDGVPHVAYSDAVGVRIKYATQLGNGSWLTSFASLPQQVSPVAIELAMTRGTQPQPIVAFKDASSDSVMIAEPGLDGDTGLWVLSYVEAPQAASSGIPLRMVLDQLDRPWVMYNYSTSLREVRLARRRENQWFQASVLSNQAQISDAFDFHLVEEDFYLIGRQNELDNTGLGLLYAENGLTTLISDPAELAGVELFPNPTQDQFTLTWAQARPSQAEVLVYDLQGRLRYQSGALSGMPGPQQHVVSLASYPPGVYLCVWQTATERQSRRVIKLPR